MKKHVLKFSELKLSRQFALVMFAVLLVPVLLLFMLIFNNMRTVMIEERVTSIRNDLTQKRVNIEKAVELCNMTTQVFLNNAPLRGYLQSVYDGDSLSIEEMLDFKNIEMHAFEKLVNANPYLYQVRVYSVREDSPEMMPILYNQSRMKRLSWAQKPWESGVWRFDYSDTIFHENVMSANAHIMALVTGIEDYARGRIGVLEVTIRMDEWMGELFSGAEDKWACFITDGGELYASPASQSRFGKHSAEILAIPHEDEQLTTSVTIGGVPALVSSLSLKQLSGRYIEVVSLENIITQMNLRRNLFFAAIFLLLVLLAFLVNLLVSAMLRRVYRMFNTVAQAESGELTVATTEWGGGEIGMFGQHINAMVDRLGQLMRENIDRQMLAKNSEIRALQNQINAHFIYNVLESIKMMAELDERYDIADAVTALGKMLRYSMRWSRSLVTVREEIEYVQSYLSLMNLRFDFVVRLSLSIPQEILSRKVPKISLQPIVENAVTHGLENLSCDSVIEISAKDCEGYFQIEIADPGKGMTQAQLDAFERRMAGEIEPEGGSGNSIGLKNVQDRITIAFGPGYGITLESRVGEYTIVRLRLPYKASEDRREAV